MWPALHVEFPSLAKLKFNAQIFRNKNRQCVAAHANLSAIFGTTADSCPIGKALAVSFVQFGLLSDALFKWMCSVLRIFLSS